ncbi:MAG: RluA family pseudouridine synthase [Proteobacteria bacterium]|nr:RluA family pseudouridine synthase [Pseudomonadota bacterium]
MPSLTVPHDLVGCKRVDLFLVEVIGDISRTQIKKMIQGGDVNVNGNSEKISPKSKVRACDVIEYHLPLVEEIEINAVPYDLDILFEDEYLLVVNKPKGVVVHPAAGHYNDTLVNYLMYHTKLSGFNTNRPGIVHRIDKDTSGLLVVAKEVGIHESLAKQFAKHEVSRKYETLVWGDPAHSSGTIDQPLGRHPKDRKKRAIKLGGKTAVTHWRVLERYKLISLLECELETGRTHQIRVHLSSIGHSIVGDLVYGKQKTFSGKYTADLQKCLINIKGQALHARTLGFVHPKTLHWHEFTSGLPAELKEIIQNLEKYWNLNPKSNNRQ